MTTQWDDIELATVEMARGLFHEIGVDDVVEAAGPLGLLGLGIPEGRGGSGATVRLAGAVVETAGAELAHGSLLHQQIAAYGLDRAQVDADEVAAAVSGVQRYLVAFDGGIGQTITPPDGSSQLPATTADVPFGVSDASLLQIGGEGSGCIRSVPADAVSIELIDGGWLNPRSEEARVVIAAGSGSVLAGTGATTRAFADGLTSMYALGVAQKLLDDTTAYAGQRRQFGVPIGSFQAIKHHLSNVSIGLRHARALAVGGLEELDVGVPDAARTLAVAKYAASSATHYAAERCLQVCGGLGFTWESRVHEHLKVISRLRQWPIAAANLRVELRRALVDLPG